MTIESSEAAELFLQAEPFHISFNSDLAITGLGRSLLNLSGSGQLGAPLFSVVEPKRPKLEATFEALGQSTGRAVLLNHIPTGMTLRGQFLVDRARNFGLFVGIPWFGQVGDYIKQNVSLDMLPIHYGTVEMLFLLQTNQASLEESRRLTQEMTRQHEELVQMEAALRLLNADLENRVEERTHELEKALEQADHASKIKSQFLSRVSHELRTPLNAILGFAQILEMDELTSDQLDSVTHVRNAGNHLLKLINEILDLSKIQSGALRISIEAVDLTCVASQVRSLLQPLADEYNVTLDIHDYCFDGQFVAADWQRLAQVFLNLGTNAIKYNIRGGHVRIVGAKTESETFEIQISDSGPGIPEERWENLFTPFDRLGAELTESSGTGLGLALCKHFVEEMDGSIRFETSPEGTTFFLQLPVAEENTQLFESLNWGSP